MTAGIFDINETGKLEIDLYFDFDCPWAYQTSLWLRDVVQMMGPELVDLRFRFFSIAQNNRSDQKWNIWDQKPEGDKSQTLLAFLAGAATLKSGGQPALDKFYLELGRMHHEEGQPLDRNTIEKAASAAGVNVKAALDGSDPSLVQELKRDHTEGVEKYGVLGSSSILFEEKYGVFVKMMPRPAPDKVLEVFQHIQMLAMVEKNVYEVKRLLNSDQKDELEAAKQSVKKTAS